MALWKEHFHWTVLLRWDVLSWTTGTALGIAGFFLVFDQYALANACFVIVAGLMFAKVVHLAVLARDKAWQRMLFTFLLTGIIGVAIVETVRGVNAYAAKKLTPPSIQPSEPLPPPAGGDYQILPAPYDGKTQAVRRDATTPKDAQFANEAMAARRHVDPNVIAAERKKRSEVRIQLSTLLSRGDQHRRNIRGALSLYRDGIHNDNEAAKSIFGELSAVTKWEIEVAKFVYTNFGEERATWAATRIPVTDYPDTSALKKLPTTSAAATNGLEDAIRDKWEALTSRMARLEQLLRDYPEL